MELPSLDLNLIVVLHALLEERNVTRAGERVGLSQPGTSSALARLRRHFNDPLLERTGGHYHLTPLAESLRTELEQTVEHLRGLLAARPHFDPAGADRTFVIRCSDSVLACLGPRLVARFAAAAPHARLDFRAISDAVVNDPLPVLRECDLLIAPRGLLTGDDLVSEDLYTDEWICVTRQDNDTFGEHLTMDQARQARWIMPFRGIPVSSPADAALTALGIDRRCSVRVESFALLGRLVTETSLLALMHARLVSHDLHTLGLRTVTLPVPLPPVTEAAWWHPGKRLDPGHRWLLELLREEAAALP
jgi:DNA-binding transcriptional LysR family regulator